MDLRFYRNFLAILILSTIVAIVGGNNGIALGKILRRKPRLADATMRLLRLGIWLPFYLLWAYRASVSKTLPPLLNTIAANIFWRNKPAFLFISFLALLAMTTVLLGSCYYFLVRCATFHAHPALAQHHLYRDIYILALLITVVWVGFYGSRWPLQLLALQFPATSYALMLLLPINSLAALLLMAVIYTSNRVFKWSLDAGSQFNRSRIALELSEHKSESLIVTVMLLGAAILPWLLLQGPLATYLSIPRPQEIWWALLTILGGDSRPIVAAIAQSLLEVAGAILWAAVFAVPMVSAGLSPTAPKLWKQFLSLSCIAPIALLESSIILFGLYTWQKVFFISGLAFFPLAQALWCLHELPLAVRLLNAVEEALPYAFIGMLMTESFASIQGIGFLITTSAQTNELPKAIALCLILFAVLVLISTTCRWIVRRAMPVESAPLVATSA